MPELAGTWQAADIGLCLPQLTRLPTQRTSLSPSARTWSYSLRATKKIMDVTLSKQWIHFRLSERWPPTSTILFKETQITQKLEHMTLKKRDMNHSVMEISTL